MANSKLVCIPRVCLFLVFAAVSQGATTQRAGYPEVTVKSGKLQGKLISILSRNVNAYLSIPYAKPPIGDLRFRKPQSADSWTGTKNVTHLPPACPQYTESPFPWYFDQPANQSEDCLYLNIWVPSPASTKKAVMFWIHGGGFDLGTSRDPLYDGSALAVTGDVIVVTINYRLGPLGFFYSGTDDASGNAGLYDILLALKWVNENIEAFNGDKDRITIFGESAGAAAVGYLTVSNLANGLYKRAILQSGSALLFGDSKEGNLILGQKLAKAMKCADDQKTLRTNPKDVMECMRRKSATRIAYESGILTPRTSVSFTPVYGDEIVGYNVQQAMKQLKIRNVDILIGVVKDEGSLFVTTANPDYFGFFGDKNLFLNKTTASKYFKNFSYKFTATNDIVNHYFGSYREDDWGELQKQLYRGVGDLIITCPCVYAAEYYSQNNSVYFYSFDHRPSTTPWAPNQGVAHYEELQFLFGKTLTEGTKYLTTELFVGKRIMKIWSDFAKTGKPESNWSLYSRNDPKVRILNSSSNAFKADEKSPYIDNCNFLRSYFERSS